MHKQAYISIIKPLNDEWDAVNYNNHVTKAYITTVCRPVCVECRQSDMQIWMYCKCRGVRAVSGLAWDGRLSSVNETGRAGFYFRQALISDARPI